MTIETLATCLLLATLTRAAETSVSKPPVQFQLQIPAQHPYLALTPADISKAKTRAAQYAWAKESLARCLSEADRAIGQSWGKLEKDQGDHRQRSYQLHRAALGYAFSGEQRYAAWVRQGLLAYAGLYSSLPAPNRGRRLFRESSLYEALWLVPVVQAYDLVAGSSVFSDAERRQIENDLLRPAAACFVIEDFQHDPRIRDLHFRCYNFQAWHLSAVGLVGLALRDPKLVEYAVNSPYGYCHLLAHDVRDDGIFWERSPGYHHFVLEALTPWTEAMAHCGVDLYHLQVPNERTRDEDAHYPTDSSDEPKSLKWMFDAPLYMAFPDLTYPALGDSDRGPLRGNWLHLVSYHRYKDAPSGWLLRRSQPLPENQAGRGRIGFLHYYNFHYRSTDCLLNGKPVKWDRLDSVYSLKDGALLAFDGQKSQSDNYCLNDTDLEDFTFECTMTRLADDLRNDRAFLIFHAWASNPGNRSAFPLMGYCREVNRAYRFRLEVKGGKARLLCDDRQVSDKPTEAVVGPPWQWLVYDLPGAHIGETWALPEGTFAKSGTFQNGCSLFPSTGLAVLREAEGDFTAQKNSTAVSFSYGPYGGGHGHPDKLNLVLYAQGRQCLPDFGSMPYESSWKAQWTSHTLSHNTLVVDEISQEPTGTVDRQWPVDSAAKKVLGKLEQFDAANHQVRASCESAYPGLRLERQVRLAGHCVLDELAVRPSQEGKAAQHQFDYVLHIDGRFLESTLKLEPRSGALGQQCGYQYVLQQQAGVVKGIQSVTFASEEHRLRIWIVPLDETPTEIILGDGLTKQPGEKLPMLILRRRTEQTRFLTVLEPIRSGKPLENVQVSNSGVGSVQMLILKSASGTREFRVPWADTKGTKR